MKIFNVRVPVLDFAGKPTGETHMKSFTQVEMAERDKKLPSDMKGCKKCHAVLPATDFGSDIRQKDALNRFCKPCHRKNCAKSSKKKKKPAVYQLFFTDGSTYIGSTIQNFDARLAVHRAKVAKNTHTNKLFNFYEPEDITGHVLMFIDKERDLRMNEYALIKHFKSVYGAKCLNYVTYKEVDCEIERKQIESSGVLAEDGGKVLNGIGPEEGMELESEDRSGGVLL